ncbi:MAG: ATP-dependent DNA helicase RecQ [Myxococcales bacterium]|nr:MAG: ATP-dependent DNA helicase RecQ [Myxococcales bacterium]
MTTPSFKSSVVDSEPSASEKCDPPELQKLLVESFGFAAFRPYQQAVCETVVAGHDALLVMPTGAGKSLCYQLPGIARGGMTLVVSPLIALMEDQAEKLRQQGFRAERIHSGRSRTDSNEVCRRYLRGELDFLFIAPERLAVPGFPEMLARRKPALVAVDEAHCISHWGHDFRPEYRLLGERLPLLRPTPVVAMTATATRLVQDDIVTLLRLADARRFIHGFRRTNIAIEIVETPPAVRNELVAELLTDSTRRPAIVYAPTRAKADELGQLLAAALPAASYHAGMSPKLRDEVQAGFLSGKLQAIVATIAFGMGIDKPDVRTVIHTALPATLEGYYQEIGRVGRDGEMSRAILLHSYADRRLHEFFMGKDYPESHVLSDVFKKLPTDFEAREQLRKRCGLQEDEFDAALEKLWIHGGAQLDADDRVRAGDAAWIEPYETQRKHKAEQLDLMFGFVQSHHCRMRGLVAHFGDESDDGRPCGLCDVCAPGQTVAGQTRELSTRERHALRAVLDTLSERGNATAGQLHADCGESLGFSRREFERVLDALACADLIALSEESFTKDGRLIRFRRAKLTAKGRDVDAAQLDEVRVSSLMDKPGKRREPRQEKAVRRARQAKTEAGIGVNGPVYDALREWRLLEAKRHRTPAFHVFSDRTLMELAAAQPSGMDDLLLIRGIGPSKASKYGEAVLRIIRKTTSGVG